MSNIYIYIKTPSIKHSNTNAHIVEHCVLNKNNISIKDFYSICDIRSECYLEYTKYDIHKKINIINFIKKICEPLDKKIFKKELMAFKQEKKYNIFTDTLKNKVEKIMYNNLWKINRKSTSWEEIDNYHKKYYKKNQIVICNSEYKIIENNLKIKKAWERYLNIKKQKIIYIWWEKNIITILPYTHRKSQVLLYFIEFLFDTYIEYTERSIKWNYNFPISSMIEMKEYVFIAIPKNIKCNISIDFLNEAKNHFCNVSLNEYARKIEIVNLLYIWQLPTDKEIKIFIQSIDIETVKKILT